jgi:hypothetical protein
VTLRASLDPKTRGALSRFVSEVAGLPNEAAKTSRFIALVAELFPGTKAINRLAEGIEKAVRISHFEGEKRGRIDAYYGNAVVEFEKSMRATGHVAIQQLQEYSAGIWAQEGYPFRPLLAIATDGIVWETYRPKLPPGMKRKPLASDVELELLSTMHLSERTISGFWIWLTSFLFRDGQVLPTAERFRVEFGTQGLAFQDSMDALRRAWGKVRTQSEAKVAVSTWAKYSRR